MQGQGKCGATIKPAGHVLSPDLAAQRHYNPYTIKRTFTEACKEIGATPMRLHDL